MRDILNKILKIEKKHLYLTVFFIFIIIAFYHVSAGYYMSSDSQRFSRWADKLIEFNFNFFDFYSIEKAEHRPHLFFFSIPVLSMAICKVFFINEWQNVFLILNLLLLLLSLIIFVNSLLMIHIKPFFIALSFPLIIISADILTWPRYILSDTIYTFFIMLAVYFISKSIVKSKIYFRELLLVIFLLLGTRPSSIPVAFVIIFFSLISNFKIFLKPKYMFLFLLTLITFTPFIFGFLYIIIESNFYEIPNFKHIIELVQAGVIIHDRPDTWIDKPDHFLNLVNLYFLRIVSFFNPYASTFSNLHIVLNLIQFFIIIFSISIWLFMNNFFKKKNDLIFFILMLSIFVAAFHSFILIDYDWRFRFPIILPLLMLFPVSLSIFLHSDKKITSN